MFAIWGLFALLASIQSEVAHIGIDDYLNTDFELFPDHSIQHHLHLDETLELFKVVLEDDSVLATAYDRFKVTKASGQIYLIYLRNKKLIC